MPYADKYSALLSIWEELYPSHPEEYILEFISELEEYKSDLVTEAPEEGWYKDAIVYSLYVDLFNKDFQGLEDKLDYLAGLGVNCLWLLPILDSPMRDAGFDISGYRRIRPELLGLQQDSDTRAQERIFSEFMEKAHSKGIRVIFDIAINHTSDQHPWFKESRKSKDNPYRDFYIWNDNDKKYSGARIIFKGIEDSNWKKDGEEYYFHRFFDFQPDLNYRNPEVLLEMSRNMLYWLKRGADGFRADAIPYLWKEEGTECENLTQTHAIVRFFRAVIDYVRPNTLLLAEACQKPKEVVKYFGDGDECHAGYHFPLMPQMFKAVKMESREPIQQILSPVVTPVIPEGCQWFTFLRCHDELSLELVYVSEADRKYIHDHYCLEPGWDFRQGQGISARLAELMERHPGKIGLIFSIMLTLPGTPVIYYGDEFGKLNDQEYYREMIRLTGKDDTRFLVRGRLNWDQIGKDLREEESFSSIIFSQVSNMINVRKKYKAFGRGNIEWLTENISDQILAYYRVLGEERILILQNLSSLNRQFSMPGFRLENTVDLLGNEISSGPGLKSYYLEPYAYYWIKI
jgi:maltose alpha-D-glucosyltransferase / alpha-amylase